MAQSIVEAPIRVDTSRKIIHVDMTTINRIDAI